METVTGGNEACSTEITVIKTDAQIHREKDNTLARKAKREVLCRGVHCDKHIYKLCVTGVVY